MNAHKIFLIFGLAVLNCILAASDVPHVKITDSFLHALKTIYDRSAHTSDYLTTLDQNSCVPTQSARELMQEAYSLLVSHFDPAEELYQKLLQVFNTYEQDLETGAVLVHEDETTRRSCKVVDCLCVRNSLRVGGNVLVRGQLSADSIETNVITTQSLQANSITSNVINSENINATSITSDIVTANIINASLVNATSITVSTINGIPIGTSGLGGIGSTGATGPQGNPGNTGPQGNTGPAITGNTGPQGAAGNTGAIGLPGNTGSTGQQGNTGIGSTGNTGPQGIQGATGATGQQGVPGVTGNTGEQGLQGPTGNTGSQGAQGATGSTGPQGIQGATGSTGLQGEPGITGSTGPTGLQGLAGATGTTGNTGAQGLQGATGNTGPQGIAGVTGNTGPQGLVGATGNTGAQGLQGNTGATGPSAPTANYFYAYKNNTQNGVLAFATVTMNVQEIINGWTVQSAGVYQASTAGIYQVTYSANFDSTDNTSQPVLAQLRINGSTVVPGSTMTTQIPSGAVNVSLSTTVLVSLAANDTISLVWVAPTVVQTGTSTLPATLSATRV